MVQSDNLNGVDNATVENSPQGVPDGRYRLVGCAVDTSGRRLIDEICQIAAYTPTAKFSQYIMPFKDINIFYSRRHMIRVINSGRYRMLVNVKTNKFIKTKSDAHALEDFVSWLEANRGDATDGIILIYHEFRKSSIAMLLEVLQKYNLLDRFRKVVAGFANGFHIAQAKCGKTTKGFSLGLMARLLLNKEEDLSSAVDRARVAYEVAVHLGQGERQDLDAQGSGDCTGVETHLVQFIQPFTNPVAAEESEIASLKELLKRQNTFRPVFGALLRATRNERQKAIILRRMLVDNNVDYEKLNAAYQEGASEGLEKFLKSEIANANEKDLSDLIEILDCFFDPKKTPIQPKPTYYQNNPRRRRKSTRKVRERKSSTTAEQATDSGNNNVEETKTDAKIDELADKIADNLNIDGPKVEQNNGNVAEVH